MGEPNAPNDRNPADAKTSQGTRGVSIPDRGRIDSDVRAFLREPSTPWIVFDQEGRPPSQLAGGEVVFRSVLSSIMPEHGFFPATAIVDAQPPASRQEPSSLAVASDLTGDVDLHALPVEKESRRARLLVGGAAVCVASLLALVVFGLWSVGGAAPGSRVARSAAQGSPVPAEPAPPDLDVKPAAEPAAPVVQAAVSSAADSMARKFGRLSITGDARSKDVFFDGKRLLGRGARTFTVTCGPHTIAVGSRSDAHELDVPCGAELAVSK